MPFQARIYMDANRKLGEISPLLFGGFAEHLGRCIYGGIYDPASPHADEDGFRTDVMQALRELNFSIIRYPGGNFVSGYNWRDGVGPRDQRPRRRELAWQSIETNQFGTNEFIQFCRKLGAEPMMGLNFGTGSIQDAADLVEYCNAPVGTKYADLRASHGFREPHNVKYWCLGNEMDGHWQIGHLEAEDYAKKAREAAKMMKWHDPNIKLVLCGSSGPGMPTYPDWDRITLEICWEQVDYLSMHYYAGNPHNDTASYLAMAVQFENHVDTLAAVLRYVKSKLRSKHDVFLSWDEWNVWYKNHVSQGGWTEAPHLLEEIYNLEDALVVAQWMNVFLRKCSVVKIACLAQIVNVIAPILTTADKILKQSTFYPFLLFRRFAGGSSLDVLVQCPKYETKQFGDVPLLDVSACLDEAGGRQAVFAVNRSQTDPAVVELVWQSGAPSVLDEVHQVAGADPKAANSFEQPNVVTAKKLPSVPVSDARAVVEFPPLSFTVMAASGSG
jgi:alpha-N-arabinofuranosidase